MVRTEVADSLGSYADDESLSTVVKMCEDPYYLVRGHAVISLAMISKNRSDCSDAIITIKRILEREKKKFNVICCLEALYMLERNDKTLYQIASVAKTASYRNQIAAINAFSEIIDDQNRDAIFKICKELEKEFQVDIVKRELAGFMETITN